MAWSAWTPLWLWLWGPYALHFVVQTQDFPSWWSSEPLIWRVRILSYCPVHLWGMKDFLEFLSLQEHLLEHLLQSLPSCSLYIQLPPALCTISGICLQIWNLPEISFGEISSNSTVLGCLIPTLDFSLISPSLIYGSKKSLGKELICGS